METRVYAGMISEGDYGEDWDALLLSDSNEPLAMRIEDDMSELGHYLSVRYFISDEPKSKEELEDYLIRQIVGLADVQYQPIYSEITGYLWTDADLWVGGHNLQKELRSHLGKYCHLEIGYSHTGKEDQEARA